MISRHESMIRQMFLSRTHRQLPDHLLSFIQSSRLCVHKPFQTSSPENWRVMKANALESVAHGSVKAWEGAFKENHGRRVDVNER